MPSRRSSRWRSTSLAAEEAHETIAPRGDRHSSTILGSLPAARAPAGFAWRTNLMMSGMIFSGDVDTDIAFDYGLFSPGCRRAGLADMRRLDMKIDLRIEHLVGYRLFPDWREAITKLRVDAAAMKLDNATFVCPVFGFVDFSSWRAFRLPFAQ